jgi:hypothetical protein
VISTQTYLDTHTNKEFIFLKLTELSDVDILLSSQQDKIDSDLQNTINHPKPSHLYTKSIISHFARINLSFEINIDDAQSTHKDFFQKISSLAFSQSQDLYTKMLKEDINLNGVTYINSAGGIWAGGKIADDRNLLISESEFKYEDLETPNLFLADDSEFLILENDPELDPWFKQNLETQSYSYLLNLRSCMEHNLLLGYLKEYLFHPERYKKNILIYTTGSDTQQMKEYLSLIADNFYDIDIKFIFADIHNCDKLTHLSIIENTKKHGIRITHNY